MSKKLMLAEIERLAKEIDIFMISDLDEYYWCDIVVRNLGDDLIEVCTKIGDLTFTKGRSAAEFLCLNVRHFDQAE